MSKLIEYKAMDEFGKMHNDSVVIENIPELEQRLHVMGLELINFKEKKESIFSFKSKKVPRSEIINFSFQMQQLTKSGVSILDGLHDLQETVEESRMKQVISSIIVEIEGGKTLSQSLEIFPDVFDNIYITLIKVGEESGNISEIFNDLAETIKWHDELISHTKKIMIYPTIVTVVVLAVVTFLMIFLIPELIPFIKNIGGEIPIHTRALIWTSDTLVNYWYLIFGLPIAAFVAIKIASKKNEKLKYNIDKLKLKTWLIGPLLLKTNLARFANYFAMMYRSGLTVLDTLKICEDLVTNVVLSKAIIDARSYIEEGEQISDSFKAVEIYPPLVVRMLKVGENTGGLDEALLNVSYFYNREVKETIDKLEAAITPVLTVILGLIMMWIMSAVLGPVYDSLTKITG
jgi:type IV pilus assembly protein PilC